MLTEKQNKTLLFIYRFIKRNGLSPTYVEIATHFGGQSKSTSYRNVHSLVERGFLRILPNKWRAIEVLKLPQVNHKYIKMDFDLETQRYSQTEIQYDPNLQKT